MSSNYLCEELELNIDFFGRVFFEKEEIYETLKTNISNKGIEEFFYPYVGAEIVKVLNEKKKIACLKRIGSGRISTERKEKIDFLLEIYNNSLGIEIKITESLNGLIFGYQGPQEIEGIDHEKLGNFFKEEIEKVRNCVPKAKGKKRISNCLITDYFKLGILIAHNFLKEGIVVGITKKAKRGKQCQGQVLEKWLEEIFNIAKEFINNNNLTIPSNNEIKVYEKDDLILIWIYIYQ